MIELELVAPRFSKFIVDCCRGLRYSWPQGGRTQLACAKHGETLAARKLARDGVQCRAAAELVE